ncbi:MAG: PilW family protein [Thermoguttaceae bacterium]|jgi:type II secretory pathway component PulJ
MVNAGFKHIRCLIAPFRSSVSEKGNLGLSPKEKGYTLVEVMIAVTLTLILMYALALIFGRVTSIMSQTQDILSMTNNLRAAKDRLREDLENLTVPTLKAPTSQYGFFSYSEGMGNAFGLLNYDLVARNGSLKSRDNFRPTNSRSFTTYGNFDRRTPTNDTTIGDTDDILSFTVRAPAGKWFRGRCFKKLPDFYSSDYDARIDDNIEMIESEYAEVIWFLRGTTLYRRVLLIIPDDLLVERLQSLNRYIHRLSPELANNNLMPSSGFGFYRFFDVSVHYDRDKTLAWSDLNDPPNNYPSVGRVVANTLPDLANRKNRFGYWGSPVIDKSMVPVGGFTFDHGLHGYFGSWYWLRMPTLQESALWTLTPDSGIPVFEYFCAGFPFGRAPFDPPPQNSGDIMRYWMGEYLRLGLGHIGPNPDNTAFTSVGLPDRFFIDQWLLPNPWIQQQLISGQLDLTGINEPEEIKSLNTDVLLTNVLSFDVKVWNEASSSFVNLGEMAFDETGEVISDPSDFRTGGNYSPFTVLWNLPPLADPVTQKVDDTAVRMDDATLYNRYYLPIMPKVFDFKPLSVTSSIYYRPIMPAVFDTWTEDYQKDFLAQTWPLTIDGVTSEVLGASSRPGFAVGDIPLDGNVTASDLPDYPPPYESEIKVMQIELRAFDPVSRTVKNATVKIKIP